MLFSRLRSLPTPQRHTVLASAFTLFLTLAAHQLMETARDSLFLQHISASRLPWMYLVIAALSLGVARAVALARHLVQPRKLIVAWILFTAVVTFAFSALTPRVGREWLLYALYIWTGVASTITLLQFWTMLGGLSSIQEAKSSFAVVGSASVLGAIAGSGAATWLAEAGFPDALLTVSGVLFTLSAAGPIWLGRLHGEVLDATDRDEGKVDSMQEIANDVFGQPYVRTLLILVFVGMLTITLVDFVFKTVVAQEVPGGDLTQFFAWFYLATNAVSLVVQMFAVQWMLRRLTVTGSLAAMPMLLLTGAISFVAGMGIAAVVAMRAVDGALRHSLQRTAIEVLYVPMRSSVRRRVKAVVDVMGHRGAQATASLGILLALQLGATVRMLGWGLVVLAAAWVAAVVAIRIRYVDVFRDRLKFAVAAPDAEFPDLDIDSLESLIAALSDPDDRRVVAALDLLEAEGRASLIPTLLIHHRSEVVVLRVFEIFAEAGREDYLDHIERLSDHRSPAIRAEIVSVLARTKKDVALLRRMAHVRDPAVSSVANVLLVSMDALTPDEGIARIRTRLREQGTAHPVARALAEARDRRLEPIYLEILHSPDREARRVAVEAAASYASTAVALALRDLLQDRDLRPFVRDALVRLGDKGRLALQKSLVDHDLPDRLRWQIPEALTLFGQPVVRSLWDAFLDETDGVMRHRVVEALTGLMTADDAREIRESLLESIAATLRRAWELRHWTSIVREVEEKTPHHRLLVRTLEDKRAHATDLALRLVGLTDTEAASDYASIRDGLRSKDELVLASSRELLEHLIDGDLRRQLLDLFDNDADPPSEFDFLRYSYEELLRRMIWGDSQLIAAIAVRVAAHRDVPGLWETIRERRESADDELRTVIDRALYDAPTQRESA